CEPKPTDPVALVGVELDAEELSPDEEVIAVDELAFGLQTDVGAVATIEIGDRELTGYLVDATVRRRHEKIAREIEVGPLASDLKGVCSCADDHARVASLQQLGDAKGARMLR